MMGREKCGGKKGTAHDPKHQTMCQTWWRQLAAIETDALVFNIHVTGDRITRMNSEVYRIRVSAHIQPKVCPSKKF